MDYIKLFPEYKEPTHKYNVLSCVVFRMPIGYKNELKYFNGLDLLTKILKQLFPYFYLRLYYDESVLNNKTVTDSEFIKNTEKHWKPLFDKMKTNKYIQLCKYEMKDLKIDPYNHNGVIGTILRFVPFLDLPENKNIDNVICSDIDLSYNGYKELSVFYNKFKQSGREFFYKTKYCYFLQDRFKQIYKYYNDKILSHPIMAGVIMTSVKVPESLLITFFKCILNLEDKSCERYKAF
jgi:hypothetical protein